MRSKDSDSQACNDCLLSHSPSASWKSKQMSTSHAAGDCIRRMKSPHTNNLQFIAQNNIYIWTNKFSQCFWCFVREKKTKSVAIFENRLRMCRQSGKVANQISWRIQIRVLKMRFVEPASQSSNQNQNQQKRTINNMQIIVALDLFDQQPHAISKLKCWWKHQRSRTSLMVSCLRFRWTQLNKHVRLK